MQYSKYTGFNLSIEALNILKSIMKQYVVICIHHPMNKNSINYCIVQYFINIFYN